MSSAAMIRRSVSAGGKNFPAPPNALSFDPTELTSEEYDKWKCFCDLIRIAKSAAPAVIPCPFKTAESIGLDLNRIHKDSFLSPAIWVAFINMNADLLLKKRGRKYPTMAEFLQRYPSFKNVEEIERDRLHEFSNWLNIFFEYMPAKKNKGLIIQVVPKIVEGWTAKYVTGSGQKGATKNRVHIYECEGNVRPFQRGKIARNKRRSDTMTSTNTEDSEECNDPLAYFHQKKRRRKTSNIGGKPKSASSRDSSDGQESTDDSVCTTNDSESNFNAQTEYSFRDSAAIQFPPISKIAPMLERFCSTESIDVATLQTLLQQCSSLESWTMESLPPVLQRFASTESVDFESCLAALREDVEIVDGISVHGAKTQEKFCPQAQRDYNQAAISSLLAQAVEEDQFQSTKADEDIRSSKLNLLPTDPDLMMSFVKRENPNSTGTLESKGIGVKDNISGICPPASGLSLVGSEISAGSEVPSDSNNVELGGIALPLLLRGISWGPINLSNSTSSCNESLAFPSPHSSYHPMDELLFPTFGK